MKKTIKRLLVVSTMCDAVLISCSKDSTPNPEVIATPAPTPTPDPEPDPTLNSISPTSGPKTTIVRENQHFNSKSAPL